MSINIFEVEGKGEENFFPQTSSDSGYEALAQ
jgi:hypothetical protein